MNIATESLSPSSALASVKTPLFPLGLHNTCWLLGAYFTYYCQVSTGQFSQLVLYSATFWSVNKIWNSTVGLGQSL